MHLVESHRQLVFDGVDPRSRATVAAIDDERQRLELACSDIRQQMLDVGFGEVQLRQRPGLVRLRRKVLGQDHLLEVAKAAVATDRDRPLLHQLHAVVALGIVTRGHHDGPVDTIIFQVHGGEIRQLCATKANVDDVDTTVEQSLSHRRGQRWRAVAHVLSHGHFAR